MRCAQFTLQLRIFKMPEKPKDFDEGKKEENSVEENSDKKEPTEEDEPYSPFSDTGSFGRSKKIFGISEGLNRFIWGSGRK